MSNRRITGKQQAFCEEYLRNGRKASDAYRAAYDCSGMKWSTVNRKATETLDKPIVKALIEKLEKEYDRLSTLKKESAVKMMADFITSDLTKAYTPDGQLKLEDLPEGIRPFVKDIKATQYGTNITLIDKGKVLDLLGKWCGWEKPKDVNVNVKDKFKGIRIGFDDEKE